MPPPGSAASPRRAGRLLRGGDDRDMATILQPRLAVGDDLLSLLQAGGDDGERSVVACDLDRADGDGSVRIEHKGVQPILAMQDRRRRRREHTRTGTDKDPGVDE